MTERFYKVNSIDTNGNPVDEKQLFASSKKAAIKKHNADLAEEGIDHDPSQTTAVLLKD